MHPVTLSSLLVVEVLSSTDFYLKIRHNYLNSCPDINSTGKELMIYTIFILKLFGNTSIIFHQSDKVHRTVTLLL